MEQNLFNCDFTETNNIRSFTTSIKGCTSEDAYTTGENNTGLIDFGDGIYWTGL
jgi:hypothetical protein